MLLPVKRLTKLALLCSVSLVLSYLENLLPLNLFIPLPGFKLGLANIVTLYLLVEMTMADAFWVMIVRTLFSALLFSGVSGFLYSVVGGIFAIAVMSLVRRKDGFSLCAVSAAGAAAHNFGQICAAAVMMKNGAAFGYLPLLLIAAIPVGILTGIIVILLLSKKGIEEKKVP